MGANDAKRGAMFTKVAREIAVAARAGGGDPEANYRLRLAMDKARSINMPAENIKRAIEKATGGGEADQFEEIVYEGYGPGGVAVLVEAATDNRNRTAAEVRSIFTKTGGQLAGSGAVAWQFEARGLITVIRDGSDPDEVALAAIDAGAVDVDTESDPIEIFTEPSDLEGVRNALDAAGVNVEGAESAMLAKQTVSLEADQVRKALRMVDLLEDLDDVQRVTTNVDIPEDVLAELAG
jgi:YebC/PmpR family DNA-binding regulatory protein